MGLGGRLVSVARALAGAAGYRPRHPVRVFLVVMLLAVAVCNAAGVRTAVISGRSMMPTLRPGQVCLIHKWPYLVGAPRRGDLVVFRHPRYSDLTVKRVVGMPGETIAFRADRVYVNGRVLEQPWGSGDGEAGAGPAASYRVPEGSYFVLGDNPAASEDSRRVGVIRSDWIIGRIHAG